MKKKIYILLIVVFCISSLAFIFGCGKYAAQYSAPVILERFPVAGAGGIGTTETLWIKFSKSMDTSGLTSIDALATKIKFATDNTAAVTFVPGTTPEVVWSEGDSKFSLVNLYFTADPGSKIHFQSSREAFQDVNGQFLTENAELWNFTLSGLNVTSRFPPIGATVANSSITHEVIFNNSLATWESFMGPGHTAGNPTPFPPTIYISADLKTITFEVSSWASGSSIVDITYEAQDIFGNVVINGQLFNYNVQ
jgi:hypothetical protein